MPNPATVVINAVTNMPMDNHAKETSSTLRRPSLSLSVPAISAPNSMPNRAYDPSSPPVDLSTVTPSARPSGSRKTGRTAP